MLFRNILIQTLICIIQNFSYKLTWKVVYHIIPLPYSWCVVYAMHYRPWAARLIFYMVFSCHYNVSCH